jgi:hypothetical protein
LYLKDKPKRGRGFWKCNASLFKDKDYVKIINKKIEECKLQYPKMENKGLLWDVIKSEIRGATISYSCHKAKARRADMAVLNKELQRLETEINTGEDSENVMIQLETTKKELEIMNNEITQGSIMRSKCTYLNEYEKSSKFFLNLEKANAKTKTITCLHLENGEIINNMNKILYEEENFYQKFVHRTYEV